MAYTDLIATQTTLVSTGGTYAAAIDTPIAADGSPHIVSLCLQFDLNFGVNNPAPTSTLSQLISSVRIKAGAMEIMNFDSPVQTADAAGVGVLGMIAQKVGGVDTVSEYVAADGSFGILGEISFPVGLPANRSHRINLLTTLLDETAWCGQALVPGASVFNLSINYGTATEATLYGSRQDFTLTANAQRALVIYGKEGWNMLGVLSQSAAQEDRLSEIRVRNGAFRSLRMAQWRINNGTAWRSPLRLVQAAAAGGAPAWITAQPGSVFLDLRRLTAGANAELLITSTAADTHSFFPVWVAPIGKKTSKAPAQTAKSVQSTTKDVVNEGTY
jgi:hypothetical protein